MNFAVIGTFWLTTEMIKAIIDSGNNYYAQFSTSKEKGRDYLNSLNLNNVLLYTDFEKMCSDKNIDIIYVASPNIFHYEQCKKILNSGKHVLCEKPICTTESEYSELCNISKDKKLILLESMMNIHTPEAKAIKEHLFGREVINAHFLFNQKSSKLERALSGDYASTFRKDRRGGVLLDLGIYAIELSEYLFGDPISINAASKFLNNVDVNTSIILNYKNFIVNIIVSKLQNSIANSEILLTDSQIEIGKISRLENVTFYLSNNNILSNQNSFNYCMVYILKDLIKYINKTELQEYEFYKKISLNSLRICDNVRNIIGYTF